ncbi:MAG: sigma-70 family RNA polymerase sigma factor [Candidatus Bipolaricaulota bacterium]|nr:sigma-70 family RNA polymerase sigma factor [Candidatus Bipolaricaulota bacterium]MDW8141444.1 sigma-70 family RNA polymerase sigma factor [Candidatus Bipolaricaulota bacterium]
MHDEIAWVHQIAQGDEKAFEKLFRCYASRIFRFAMSYLNDRSHAEEVVQETMIAVWKSAKDFQEQSQVSTWVLGIARNKALDRARVRQREPELLREKFDRRASAHATPEQIAQREIHIERVRAALEKLSPEHREVMLLAFYNDLSYAEIAQILGCPEGTVKSRVYYAKEQLKKILNEGGETL